MQALADLTREHWAAQQRRDRESDDGYRDFTDKVLLVLTALERLQQHGPQGPACRRVAQGRGKFEPLLTALTDTRTQAAWQRDRRRRAAAEARQEAEQAAQQAELQGWAEDDEDDDEPGPQEVGCADCGIPVNEPAGPYAEKTGGIAVPPEGGVSCWVCRQNQAARNRGLRGALRGLRRQRGSTGSGVASGVSRCPVSCPGPGRTPLNAPFTAENVTA